MAGVENQKSIPAIRGIALALIDIGLLAGAAVAAALTGTAISRLGKFAIRPNAGLSHGAPEQPIA